MREKVAILTTMVAVFFLLYFVTLRAQREGKKCSFYSVNILFLYTRKCFRDGKRKWFLFIIEILTFSVTNLVRFLSFETEV